MENSVLLFFLFPSAKIARSPAFMVLDSDDFQMHRF